MEPKQTPRSFETFIADYPEQMQRDARHVLLAFWPSIQRELETGQARTSEAFAGSMAKVLLSLAGDFPRLDDDSYLADLGSVVSKFREDLLALGQKTQLELAATLV